MWSLIAAGATAGIAGGATGSLGSAAQYGLLAGLGTATLLKFFVPNATVSWTSSRKTKRISLA